MNQFMNQPELEQFHLNQTDLLTLQCGRMSLQHARDSKFTGDLWLTVLYLPTSQAGEDCT